MPFNWDDFPAEAGVSGEFVTSDEKTVWAVNKVPFYVTKITERMGRAFNNQPPKPEWVIAVITMEGTEKVLTFDKGNIAARDKQCMGLKGHLETEGAEPVKAILVKVGRSYQIQGADK